MWPIYESEHFWIGCLLMWTSLQRITAPPVHIVGQGERGYAAEWSKVMPLREVSAEYFRKHLFPDQSPPPSIPLPPQGYQTKDISWLENNSTETLLQSTIPQERKMGSKRFYHYPKCANVFICWLHLVVLSIFNGYTSTFWLQIWAPEVRWFALYQRRAEKGWLVTSVLL